MVPPENVAPSIEKMPLPNTAGYDFHYVIPENETQKARNLLENCVRTINHLLPLEGVYLVGHKQHSTAIGPWNEPMWEIQISTVDNHDPCDPSATDTGKLTINHAFMKKIAAYLKSEITSQSLQGSLLIHANVWPKNSDQIFERRLHFDHAWLVCGKTIALKDIWLCSGGLIEMEDFIKKNLHSDLENKTIINTFKNKFKGHALFSSEQISKLADVLLNAQQNLLKMKQRRALCR